MNVIVNKLLLSGDKFTSEMHLRQSGFTYSACGAFTKNKERIKSFKEIGDSIYIDQNELQIRWSLFLTWYGFWRICTFKQKNSCW